MICTSIPLRTSTRVSPGFILVTNRSPPLGYTLCRSTAPAPRARSPGPGGRAAGRRPPVREHRRRRTRPSRVVPGGGAEPPLGENWPSLRVKGSSAPHPRGTGTGRQPFPLAAECNSLVRVPRRVPGHRTPETVGRMRRIHPGDGSGCGRRPQRPPAHTWSADGKRKSAARQAQRSPRPPTGPAPCGEERGAPASGPQTAWIAQLMGSAMLGPGGRASREGGHARPRHLAMSGSCAAVGGL